MLMPPRPILISLLVLLQMLFSCQNDNSKSKTHKGLPIAEKKASKPTYDPMLQALHLLQKDPLLQNASLGYLVVDVTTRDLIIVADYHAK